MDDLTGALRYERELLDQLRFRFIETRLLLAAREIRYLAWATSEIEQARSRAREADLMRAAHVHRILADTPVEGSGTPTLRDVASIAGQPWSCILRDHHEGLCALVSEIELIGHRNAELARGGLHDVASRSGPSHFDSLLATATSAASEEHSAAATSRSWAAVDELVSSAEHAAQLADERAFQQVITTASRLRMPALLAFLR